MKPNKAKHRYCAVNRDMSVHFENEIRFQEKRGTRLLSFSILIYW